MCEFCELRLSANVDEHCVSGSKAAVVSVLPRIQLVLSHVNNDTISSASGCGCGYGTRMPSAAMIGRIRVCMNTARRARAIGRTWRERSCRTRNGLFCDRS